MPKDIVKSSEHLSGEQLRSHSRPFGVCSRKQNSRSTRERAMLKENKKAPRIPITLAVWALLAVLGCIHRGKPEHSVSKLVSLSKPCTCVSQHRVECSLVLRDLSPKSKALAIPSWRQLLGKKMKTQTHVCLKVCKHA